MKVTNFFIILLFLIFTLAGCGRKVAKQEELSYTKAVSDYTSDRSGSLESPIQMTDITAEAGIDFSHVTGAFGEKWMPETVGSGGGFFDFDNDELVDIFLVNSKDWDGHPVSALKATSKLYKNQGDGTFKDVSASSGINFSLYGMGSSFADFDADGDMDIYLTAVGTNKLLRNEGGKFADITNEMKVSGNNPQANSIESWSTGALWFDYDHDGWLDLFVANYVQWTPETDIYVTRDGKNKSYATPDVYKGESCRLYKNKNGKGFEDVSEKAGVFNPEGKSLGVAMEDFNNDGWPDLVVSNDTQPNFLYLNNGDGTFTNHANGAGIGYDEKGRARAGMGIDVADIMNDDKLAIAIGNFSQEPLSLYTQIGSGELFQDRAGAMRLTRSSLLQLTFGLQFCDFDLDGKLDLITANGHIEPEINEIQKDITFEQIPQLFYNSEGKFVDMSSDAGLAFTQPVVGRGISTADIDQDGDMDVLLTVNGGSPKLLRNDSDRDKHFIGLRLKGTSPNLQAIGAQIVCYTDDTRQRRMVRTGSSFLSQSDIQTTIFGVNKNELVDSVKITWPKSGKITKLVNLKVNQVYEVKE